MNARKLKKALRLVEFPPMEEIIKEIKIIKENEDGSVDGEMKVPLYRIKAGSRHTKYAEMWVSALNDAWIERLKEATEEKLQEEEI